MPTWCSSQQPASIDVDEMVRLALENGGKAHRQPQDHGFMYGDGFEDPDGHIWVLMHMVPAAVQS
jgi:predicted lactoylglutathione lyase